jgi:hypothetical protein
MVGYLCHFDFALGIGMTNNDDWVMPFCNILQLLVLFHSLAHDRNY